MVGNLLHFTILISQFKSKWNWDSLCYLKLFYHLPLSELKYRAFQNA